MKGRAIRYSAEELGWLEEHKGLSLGDYAAAFDERFGREDVTAVHLKSLRERRGWRTGRSGRFAAGDAPHNKGRAMPSRGRSAETQFKRGQRSGRAAENYKPIGTERWSKEGYLQRKVHDGLPFQSRWQAVHLIEWEAANGPLPGGMALKCLDGDRANVAADNWKAVPRAMLPRLAGGPHGQLVAYDQATPELRQTILAAAELNHRAREARKARGAR